MEIAKQAENLGFHGIATGDHLFYPVKPSTKYPYTESGKPGFALDSPWPDVWVLFGALSALTSHLHFMPTVYILPLRHPLVVARAMGTAAVLAEGRIELGVGVGHLKNEFDALQVDFSTRGRRTDEAIVALRSLLTTGPVSHHGNFWQIEPMYLHPAPSKPIPIFVGGESKAALERTARLGDGYISIPHTLEDLETLMHELRRLRAALAPELPPLRFHLHGSDLRTVGDYRRLADAGAEAVNIGFWRRGREPLAIEERIETMQEFAATVISKL
ncbi:MAG: TIGR03619 family F420-dependent LLM class oxidoreductase [Acidimicrobiaceae bacterium]|nr:TIGR03619 family F420-dependent LLM class oxidoreductase [Acidimicrobiaceae bacterium]